jgi:hypothetical protein
MARDFRKCKDCGALQAGVGGRVGTKTGARKGIGEKEGAKEGSSSVVTTTPQTGPPLASLGGTEKRSSGV